MEFDSEQQSEEAVRRTGGDARVVSDAAGIGDRVLALQRQAGNGAVVRALGLQGRTLAREPWTFSPLKPAPPDLRPWESPDPAVRARWEQDCVGSRAGPVGSRSPSPRRGSRTRCRRR